MHTRNLFSFKKMGYIAPAVIRTSRTIAGVIKRFLVLKKCSSIHIQPAFGGESYATTSVVSGSNTIKSIYAFFNYLGDVFGMANAQKMPGFILGQFSDDPTNHSGHFFLIITEFSTNTKPSERQ